MNRIAKLILWLATIVLVLAGQALAQETRPLTFDDLIGFGRVSDPQVAPGGQWVAYVVDYYDKDTNARRSNLWVASLPSGDNRRLTRTEKRDRWPRWAPDGKTLGFLSNRSGSWQVWTIRVDGGEAIQLTELPVDITAFEWSPSGKRLVFAADVYPDCEDLECTKKGDEEKAESGVSAVLYDQLLYRHWDAWWDGKRTHVFAMPAQGGEARDLTPGDWSVPAYLDGSQGFDLSPAGNELAFSRNTDRNAAWSTNGDVWTAPTSGGEPKRITTNPAWDGSPQYSPDGKWIAYLAMERAGFEADRTRLVLYERATGERRELTPEFPNSVGDFVWAPDSQSLYFISSVEARHPIYQVSLADGHIRQVVAGYNNALSVTPDGTTLIFTQQAMNRPAEVFRAGVRGGSAKPVSHINDKRLAGLEMNPGESFTVEGAKGTPVQSWLLKPPGFDPAKKYPVVVLIHGGPQGTWGDQFHYRWNAQMFAAPGYVVVMPNPRGSPGWGQKFVDEISRDWGGKVYQDIMRVVDDVEGLPFVDKTRICAGGGSYGGYMADWILGHSDRFRCLFSHAGVYNLESMYGATEELWFPEWEFDGTPWTNAELYQRWSPHKFAGAFRTPTLIIHGALDYRVPLEQGLQLFTALQRRGVPSKFLYYPDEGHWILKPKNGALWYETVHAWLAEYLK